MIYGLVGLPGSGKTLFLTVLGYIAYRKGYTVMSNFKLKFRHERIDLEKLARFQIQNVFLLLDEIYQLVDSRRSLSLVNQALSYLILQSRKRNFHLAYSAQILGMADLRIRAITNYRIHCVNEVENRRFKYIFLPNAGKYFIYELPYSKAAYFVKLFDTSEYYDIIESLRFVNTLKERIERGIDNEE